MDLLYNNSTAQATDIDSLTLAMTWCIAIYILFGLNFGAWPLQEFFWLQPAYALLFTISLIFLILLT